MSEVQIGAQMYTVRDHTRTASDIARTCRRLKEIGYGAVQVSALGKIAEQELAKILDGEGLICAATHVSLEEMMDTSRCLAYHETLRCQFTALGGFRGKTLDQWKDFADRFTAVASNLSPHGLFAGYHNHSHEWSLVDGRRPIDILVDQLKEPAWFELDTYWVAYAGADPVAWIDRFAAQGGGRIPCVHVKDMQITVDGRQKMCEVGDGNLDWAGIVAACRRAGVRWYLVERDTGDLDPFESLRRSLENLQQMGLY